MRPLALIPLLVAPLALVASRPRFSPPLTTTRSWAPDVRLVRSIAATPKNGFVGTLADGTRVEVAKVCAWSPTVRCWTPDGRPLRGSHREVPFDRRAAHSRTVVVRFAAKTARASGGLGSGTRPGGPTALEFGGGDSLVRAGLCTSYSFLGVPREDAATASFTFGLTQGAWERVADVPPKSASLNRAGIAGIELRSPVRARTTAAWRPVARVEDGLTKLTFLVPAEVGLDEFVATARRRDGKVQPLRLHDSGREGERTRHTFLWKRPLANLRSVRIERQRWHHVELVDVRLRPVR